MAVPDPMVLRSGLGGPCRMLLRTALGSIIDAVCRARGLILPPVFQEMPPAPPRVLSTHPSTTPAGVVPKPPSRLQGTEEEGSFGIRCERRV